ncbi:hypothetical protein CASFOL_013995 [Castilleja foliolosa]|uniref:Protein ENHANCED DISEASE RESISTANCE 2 C-terminal domain-containing protein n=1 Tax=Castilleja foliolosa TaxID=1961234 RepID=A0ABD3DQN7_9LAMI
MRNRSKRRNIKRTHSHLPDPSSDGRTDKLSPLPEDRAFNSPTIHGSIEEAWFDSAAVLESNWSDEDYQSIPDDLFSLSGSEVTNPTSEEHLEASSAGTLSRNSINGTPKMKPKEPETRPVYAETSRVKDSLLDNCGISPNNCLPCLASAVSNTVEKRKSWSSSPTSTRKKGPSKMSKLPLSSKALLQRPIAGSQVPFCPLGKRVPDSWSKIEPGTFRDEKKELSPNCAAYYPVGLDVFLSPRKINHVARLVELPFMNYSEKLKLPPILVVNVQIPLYPTAIFQGDTDGEGISFVLYFKLSENSAKVLPVHFQENIRSTTMKGKVKGFRSDTSIPFRERLKILGRVANVDDLPMSSAERKLMHAYNEKPVLSRPQHDFYMRITKNPFFHVLNMIFTRENYFEIDLDMHRFSYISRKGFETYIDRLKLCVLDFGLTIQGNKAEELPENILCCIRLNEIDYSNYNQLRFHDETLE